MTGRFQVTSAPRKNIPKREVDSSRFSARLKITFQLTEELFLVVIVQFMKNLPEPLTRKEYYLTFKFSIQPECFLT